MKRLLVATGGGDCPGLNAVIRAIVHRASQENDWEILGSIQAFNGILWEPQEIVVLDIKKVSGIHFQGGTIIETTNRGGPFCWPIKNQDGSWGEVDRSDEMIRKLQYLGVDGVINIGGDGSQRISQKFWEKGLNIIGVPKTIDNDLPATDVTFGFNTSLETICDALDKIHTTAYSHDRVMVVEVMGRLSGWLALEGGMAGSADVIIIPEIPYDINKIVEKVAQRDAFGRNFTIIIISEGATPIGGEVTIREMVEDSPDSVRLGGIGDIITRQLQKLIPNHEVRYTNLAYLQRGGMTSQFDRSLGLLFGVHAVELLMKGKSNVMVQLKGREVSHTQLTEVVGSGETGETSKGGKKLVDPKGQYVQTAKAIGISFGD